MTQAELAERSGVTPGRISQLELGQGVPSRETAEKLGDALGLSSEARQSFYAVSRQHMAKKERQGDEPHQRRMFLDFGGHVEMTINADLLTASRRDRAFVNALLDLFEDHDQNNDEVEQ